LLWIFVLRFGDLELRRHSFGFRSEFELGGMRGILCLCFSVLIDGLIFVGLLRAYGTDF